MAGFGDAQLMKKMAERLNGKNDEELVEEIRKLKGIMGTDGGKLKKQIESLKPLREMLDEEQKSRFDLIMETLAED